MSSEDYLRTLQAELAKATDPDDIARLQREIDHVLDAQLRDARAVPPTIRRTRMS